MSDALFSSEVEPPEVRDVGRLWLADVLDLALCALLGWGALRAGDVERSPGALIAAGLGFWLVTSVLGGVSGWTWGRGVVGLRLVTEQGVPGPARGGARALSALVDLLVSPALQRRPFDRMLGVRGEPVALRDRARRASFVWLALWTVLGLVAVNFLRVPTHTEALKFLKTLDGWRCCHGRTSASAPKCEPSLERALRDARGGDAQAQAVVEQCPEAAARR